MKTALFNVPNFIFSKWYFLLFSLLTLPIKSQAQVATLAESKRLKADSKFGKDDKLVEDKTFNSVIRKDLQYVILGEETPLSGFSLDVSDKTKAKISGNLPFFKKGIHNLELEAGQKDNNIPLFENGKYSGQLELKYNWQIIPTWNSYSFLKNSDLVAKKLFALKKKELNDDMLDSLEVLAYLVYSKDLDMFKVATELPLLKIHRADKLTQNHYSDLTRQAKPIVDNHNVPTNRSLFRSLSKKYFPTIPIYPILDDAEIDSIVQQATDYKADLLFKDFNHLIARLSKRNELNVEAEIAVAKPFWLNKHYWWFTISPSVNYQGYNIYGIEKEGTPVPPKTTIAHVRGKISGWITHYNLYRKAGYLWRLGPELIYGNFLSDFTEVKYYVRDTLQADKDGNLVLSETVTSGLYRKAVSTRTFHAYLNLHGEYFILPRKTLMPGLNIKLSLLKDELLPKDPYQVRGQIGLVFNLLNKEKDKPVISILPYFRFSNFRDQEVKEVDNVRLMTVREKLSVGITIGIPIKGLSFEKE